MFTDWVNKVIAEQTDPEDNDGGDTNPTDNPLAPAPSFTELTDDILVIVSERSAEPPAVSNLMDRPTQQNQRTKQGELLLSFFK